MAIWPACAWGLLDAALVEIRGLWIALQPFRAPKWPWRDGRGRAQVAGYARCPACWSGWLRCRIRVIRAACAMLWLSCSP